MALDSEKQLRVALISRHVLPKNEDGKKELPSDFTSMLLETAIKLHDRQIERDSWWKPYMVVIIAGIFTLLGAWLKS